MKILHYGLGFPPQRKGGLVQYSLDLVEEQKNKGNRLIFLYPGKIDLLRKEVRLKKQIALSTKSLEVYELVNSLPLPIFGGISNPEKYMLQIRDRKRIKDFFINLNLDIVHIHTFMGLYKEFIDILKELDIKIVYTTHDYFGLFPTPHFFLEGQSIDKQNTLENWLKASKNASSVLKNRVFQLKYYPTIRKLGQIILKKRPSSLNSNIKIILDNKDKSRISSYKKLRDYYYSMFNMIDYFHFNSNISKEVFIENLEKKVEYEVIPITNSKVRKRDYPISIKKNNKLRVGYIGPYEEYYKGFYVFKETSEKIKKINENISFYVWGDTKEIESDVIENNKRFNNIESVYKKIDLLIVPSLWKETFGFNVVEALSYGIPVFVSSNVGAKDLLNSRYVFNSLDELEALIIDYYFNFNYEFPVDIPTITDHCERILNMYRRVRIK